MIITGKIYGVDVKILLDMGGELNLMSKGCYENLPVRPKLDQAAYGKILTINGDSEEILGKISVKIRIGEFGTMADFYVVPGSKGTFILGREFINRNVESINMKKKGLVLVKDNRKFSAPRSY